MALQAVSSVCRRGLRLTFLSSAYSPAVRTTRASPAPGSGAPQIPGAVRSLSLGVRQTWTLLALPRPGRQALGQLGHLRGFSR